MSDPPVFRAEEFGEGRIAILEYWQSWTFFVLVFVRFGMSCVFLNGNNPYATFRDMMIERGVGNEGGFEHEHEGEYKDEWYWAKR